MWTVSNIGCLVILAVLAGIDFRERQLPVRLLGAISILTMIFRVLNWNDAGFLWFGGSLIGVVFLLVSRMTGEKLGYGDSWIILLLGVFLGVWELLYLLAIAFFLAALIGIICLCLRKKKSTTIPFVPLLMLAYLGGQIL